MKKRLAAILSMVMLLLVGVVGCTSGDKSTKDSNSKLNHDFQSSDSF